MVTPLRHPTECLTVEGKTVSGFNPKGTNCSYDCFIILFRIKNRVDIKPCIAAVLCGAVFKEVAFVSFLYLYKLYHDYYIGIVRFVTIYLFVLIAEVVPSLAVSKQINAGRYMLYELGWLCHHLLQKRLESFDTLWIAYNSKCPFSSSL